MSKNLPKQSPRTTKEEDDKDLLRFEFETLLEEYRIVTTHISNRLDADDKGVEIGLTAVGALIAAAATLIEPQKYPLLLVLTIPFHILFWAQVRRVQTARRLSEYVTKTIAPRLNEIIQKTSPFPSRYGKPIHFTSWEGSFGEQARKNGLTYYTIALSQAGRALVYLSPTIILPAVYFFLRQAGTSYPILPFDTLLIWVNIVFMGLSVIMLVRTLFSAR